MPTLSPIPPTATRVIPPTHPPYPYACQVIGKVPGDGSVFKPNTDFGIKFYLHNVGTKTWAQGADLLFSGGTKMLTVMVVYELPKVSPGDQVGPYIFDARSPKKAGTYTMTFKVQGGFCSPYIFITVSP